MSRKIKMAANGRHLCIAKDISMPFSSNSMGKHRPISLILLNVEGGNCMRVIPLAKSKGKRKHDGWVM